MEDESSNRALFQLKLDFGEDNSDPSPRAQKFIEVMTSAWEESVSKVTTRLIDMLGLLREVEDTDNIDVMTTCIMDCEVLESEIRRDIEKLSQSINHQTKTIPTLIEGIQGSTLKRTDKEHILAEYVPKMKEQ